MKKENLLKVLPLAALVILTACGPTGDGGKILDTTITFSHRNSQTASELIDTFIAEFQAIPGNEKINIVNNKFSGNYNQLRDQVISDMGTGEYPDLVECYPDHVVRYMDFGKPVDLTKYINDSKEGWTQDDLNDMVPAFMEEGEMYPVEGIYSLPLSKSTEAMFYNETVLFAAGLGEALHAIDAEVPTVINAEYLNNLTWEHFFGHLAPALMTYNDSLPAGSKIIDTTQLHYGVLGYDSDDNFFITLCEQYGYGYTDVNTATGEGVLNFNNANVRNLLREFNSYSNSHYLSTQGVCNDYINAYFTKNAFLFSVGSTAGYKYQQQNFADQVGVAAIPHAAAGSLKIINQGPSAAVLSHGDPDRELAAWKFYKFFAEKTQNIRWATTTGYLPVRNSVYTDEAYFEYCNEEGREAASVDKLAARTAAYCTNVTDNLFSNATFKGSSKCREQVGALMTNILMKASAECTEAWVLSQFDLAESAIRLDM
ncbi:MAG TPA: extracellular solute-binding protein [Bacilli bacterium]|nr:extracellular solute-binding protein [Bacilli bacterium]HPS18857.1 extracellular solute-binding protein [Bacilli bacterium]